MTDNDTMNPDEMNTDQNTDGGTTDAERLANEGSGVSVPQSDPTGAAGVIPPPEVPLPDGETYPEQHERDADSPDALNEDFDAILTDDLKKAAGIEDRNPPESGPGGNPFLQQNL